jgi:alpha-mannosidase
MFFASSASFYKLVKETSPELFEDIKRLVEDGRWRIVGGWWVEPDCNLPSGEALARHSLYGQRYLLKEFGFTATVGYNIDSFGHSIAIPQILRKSGIKYYVFMRPSPSEKELPSWIFRWSSPDGSELIAHRILKSYCASGHNIEEVIKDVAREVKPPLDALLCFFGQGDHGGGPTFNDLEIIEKLKEKVKPFELKFAPLEEFFMRVECLRDELPLVNEELQHHASGCYAAVSKVKKLNRTVEESLVAAEKYNFMANILVGTDYYGEELYRAWTNLLFCQFHDVLAGTCIKSAYEDDIYPMLEEALSIARRISNHSVQSIAFKLNIDECSVVVFNPHAFPVKAPVELNWIGGAIPHHLSDHQGNVIECQTAKGEALVEGTSKLVFVADLPALGYKAYVSSPPSLGGLIGNGELVAGENYEENRWLRIELDKNNGTLSRLVLKDKTGEYVLLKGDGAKFLVLEDESDTWSHGVFSFNKVIGEFRCDGVRLIEAGPVRAVIRSSYRYGCSRIVQDFILYKELDYLLCNVEVDWHDRLKMLKLAFPLDLVETEATYEVQYGSIKRPCNGEEEPGLRWVDVTGKYDQRRFLGLTLVNDSKYSYDVKGNVLRLTVLRSPPYAHHEPTKLEHGESYEYIDQGIQNFSYALKPHMDMLRPCEVMRVADLLTAPPIAIREHKHGGELPPTMSLARVSNDDVILKVIKKSENSSGWILRLYETSGHYANTQLSIPALKTSIKIELKPYEIKTYLVTADGKFFEEVNIVEERIITS